MQVLVVIIRGREEGRSVMSTEESFISGNVKAMFVVRLSNLIFKIGSDRISLVE